MQVQAGSIVQGWHHWHPRCARAVPGGVWATHLCCRRVCCTIHLLNILQPAQDVLVWQLDRQRTILPSLVGGVPVALQHRQHRPLRCLEMTVLRELALLIRDVNSMKLQRRLHLSHGTPDPFGTGITQGLPAWAQVCQLSQLE